MGKTRWTKEAVERELKKISSLKELRKNRALEGALDRHGLNHLKEKLSKEFTKWTKENLKEEALKFNSVKEWIAKSPRSYFSAVRKNYYKNLTIHMDKKKRDNFTKASLIKIAKKYKNTSEWIKEDDSSYHSALRKFGRKDKDIFGHFGKRIPHNFKWDREAIIKEAKKYNTLKDWQLNSPSSYNSSSRLNCKKEASYHMERYGNLKKRCIYQIKVKGEKIIYIGLTYRFSRRIKDHLNSKRFINLKKKYGENSLEIKKLTNYEDTNLISKLEEKLIERYRKKNFQVLNIAQGGGLGGNTVYWSKDKLINDARKYKTRTEWQKNSRSSYVTASRIPEIFKEATKHMSYVIRPDWTKDSIFRDALKYKTLKEWHKKSPSAVIRARHLNILEIATKHMERPKNYPWIKKGREEILKEAKKYRRLKDWYVNSHGSLKAAKSLGIFKLASSHMKMKKINE